MLLPRNTVNSFVSVLFLLSFLLFPTDGFAAVFNVTDEAELRNALDMAATNGEDDTINIAAGTYNTDGTTFEYGEPSEENFALTIAGAGAGATILDGGNGEQVLDIFQIFLDDFNADVTITGLTIRNGNDPTPTGGGGLFVQTDSANITIENCEFSDNSADGTGGGASVQSFSGNITLTNNTFTDNTADGAGGGASVGNESGDITLTDNTFTDNSADNNGGGATVGNESGDITLTDNTFTDNSAVADGGGANVRTDSGGVTLTDNTFTNNSTVENGGGATVDSELGNVTLTNNTFTDNSADSDGGGADVFAAGNVTLTDNTFTDNSADSDGGGAGVETFSGDVTLTNNIFDNNSVGSRGGGAFIDNDEGITTLTNNSFTNNSAPSNGGGVRVQAQLGDVTLTNNTFTNNSTDSNGGGLWVSLIDDTTTLNIFNNIIRGNTATGDGDDTYVLDDDNSNDIGSSLNLFTNDFSDFFSDCESRPLFCTSNITEGGNIDEDPLFVDGASGDVHLREGSPCIDVGNPAAPALPDTDFEGDPRDVDGDEDGNFLPDIGADEFIPGLVPPPSGEGGGGCSIVQSGAPKSIPLYLLIPVCVLMRRLWRYYAEDAKKG